jgi:hypothetical protein
MLTRDTTASKKRATNRTVLYYLFIWIHNNFLNTKLLKDKQFCTSLSVNFMGDLFRIENRELYSIPKQTTNLICYFIKRLNINKIKSEDSLTEEKMLGGHDSKTKCSLLFNYQGHPKPQLNEGELSFSYYQAATQPRLVMEKFSRMLIICLQTSV